MSYPSGPPGGYPGPPPQQQGPSVFGQPPSAPNPLSRLGVPGLLTLAVFVLALAAYFCSFGGGNGFEVLALLAGGLLAGLSLLRPNQGLLPFAAVLSVVGGLGFLDVVINDSQGGLPTAAILVLVLGLLQAVAAVVAVLMDYGVVKLAPRPAVPHPAAPAYPAQGGYGPPPGQHHQQQQATQYMGGGQGASPQSTQFLQQPGQISHPQTPPGGNAGNE
ncbi:MAG TPA: DUF5336 domain-containing protein [Pseudonocardiaceae bacterium]|nr:DUF5336 domain-containing protein [Pseudonocardiaceae bacterium]